MENKLKLCGYGILLSVVLLAVYQLLVINRAVVDIVVETDQLNLFKIYYNESGGQWSEEKVGKYLISPEKTEYSVRLIDIRKIDELRIDTSESQVNVIVKSIIIRQPGFQPIQITSPDQFESLRVGPGVENFSFSAEGIEVIPSTKDPQLFYQLPELVEVNDALARGVIACCIVLLSFGLVFFFAKTVENYNFVPCLGLIALVLIIVMAGISKYNKHPDEIVHVPAAEYYMDNFMPPEIGAEGTLHTYSIYGVSRLHKGEIAYFFAGKFAKLLEPLQLPAYLAVRYFNVTLFALLLVGAFLSFHFRIIFIPLLLSPQIWYVFSYFNSEAFAVFVLLLVSYQMVYQKSWWNRLTSDYEDFPAAPLAVAGLGVLLGLVFLIKKNFYFYLVFLSVYLIWRVFFDKTELTRTVIFRVVGVLLVGGCVFGAVRGVDAYVNDFQKGEKILEARELYANPSYKPSTPLEEKFPLLQMKERGLTFEGMIKEMKWGERIFRSSFGEYGYTSVAGSALYYDFVRYSCFALAVVVVVSILATGRLEGITLLTATAGCAVALMAMAFYHAWSVDFQAQGRYFLPIVGMLSIMTYHVRQSLSNSMCYVMLGVFFLVSVYSYVFIALAGIAKLTIAIG